MFKETLLTALRIAAITGALFGFILFLIPMLVANICNIGNVTGMALCALLSGYLFFIKPVNQWMVQVWSGLPGRIILITAMVLLSGIVVLAGVITGFMVAGANRQPIGEPTVVVLGCKVNGERASLMLTERLEAAYDYLTDHPESVCVLSGGQGVGEDISEAECMARYLIEKGIDPSRLYKEDRSTSTRENLAFSLELIREQGLDETLAVVTNEFHEYRATVIAAELGLETYAVSARTQFWLLPTYYVREMYGILYEWIA